MTSKLDRPASNARTQAILAWADRVASGKIVAPPLVRFQELHQTRVPIRWGKEENEEGEEIGEVRESWAPARVFADVCVEPASYCDRLARSIRMHGTAAVFEREQAHKAVDIGPAPVLDEPFVGDTCIAYDDVWHIERAQEELAQLDALQAAMENRGVYPTE